MNIYILQLQKLWCLFSRSRLVKLPNASVVTYGVPKMSSLNELCCVGRNSGMRNRHNFLFDIFLIKDSAKLPVENHLVTQFGCTQFIRSCFSHRQISYKHHVKWKIFQNLRNHNFCNNKTDLVILQGKILDWIFTRLFRPANNAFSKL